MEQSQEVLPTPSGVTAPRPVTTTLRIASYKPAPISEVNVPYYQSSTGPRSKSRELEALISTTSLA